MEHETLIYGKTKWAEEIITNLGKSIIVNNYREKIHHWIILETFLDNRFLWCPI